MLGLDIQEATLPPKHCDDRVKVMTADARLLTPDMLLAHTKDVSGKGGGWGQGAGDGGQALSTASCFTLEAVRQGGCTRRGTGRRT